MGWAHRLIDTGSTRTTVNHKGVTSIHLATAASEFNPFTPLRLYTLPYWSNPPFLIADIRTQRPNVKNKNGGLQQYGAEPFEQQQFGTAGIVNGSVRRHGKVKQIYIGA